MFIGVVFCGLATFSLTKKEHLVSTCSTAYNLTEKYHFIGLSIFILGLFLTLFPIVVNWYQENLPKPKYQRD